MKTKERTRGRRSRQRCPRGAHRHQSTRSSSQQESAELLKKPARESGFSAALPPSGSRENKLPLSGTEKSRSPWVYPPSLPPARRELAAKPDVKVPIGEQSLHSKTLGSAVGGVAGCQHSLNLGAPTWPVHPKTMDTSWAPSQCSDTPG